MSQMFFKKIVMVMAVVGMCVCMFSQRRMCHNYKYSLIRICRKLKFEITRKK